MPSLPPPPAAPSSDERNLAVLAHVTALAFFVGIPPFVGPLILWVLKREQPFVEEHSKTALNFNLSLLLYGVAGVVLGVLTLGLGFLVVGPLLLVVAILWLVWTIQGAMAASRGEHYRYPLAIRFVR